MKKPCRFLNECKYAGSCSRKSFDDFTDEEWENLKENQKYWHKVYEEEYELGGQG